MTKLIKINNNYINVDHIVEITEPDEKGKRTLRLSKEGLGYTYYINEKALNKILNDKDVRVIYPVSCKEDTNDNGICWDCNPAKEEQMK